MLRVDIDLRTSFGTSPGDIKDLLSRLSKLDLVKNNEDAVTVFLPEKGEISELALAIIWTKLREVQNRGLKCEKQLIYKQNSQEFFNERHFFDQLVGGSSGSPFSKEVPFHFDTFSLGDNEDRTATKVAEAVKKSIISMNLRDEAYVHILELVSNAFHHSQTTSDVGCVSYFNTKNGALDFCIADQGGGIKKSFTRNPALKNEYSTITDPEILHRATEQYVTCNPINAPQYHHGNSGIGLYFLREFCALHEGRLVIVSGKGYYSVDERHIKKKVLSSPWQGTVVSFRANLSSELHTNYAKMKDSFVEDFDEKVFNFT